MAYLLGKGATDPIEPPEGALAALLLLAGRRQRRRRALPARPLTAHSGLFNRRFQAQNSTYNQSGVNLNIGGNLSASAGGSIVGQGVNANVGGSSSLSAGGDIQLTTALQGHIQTYDNYQNRYDSSGGLIRINETCTATVNAGGHITAAVATDTRHIEDSLTTSTIRWQSTNSTGQIQH